MRPNLRSVPLVLKHELRCAILPDDTDVNIVLQVVVRRQVILDCYIGDVRENTQQVQRCHRRTGLQMHDA